MPKETEIKFEPLETVIDPNVDIEFPVFPAGLVKARVKGFTTEAKEGSSNPNPNTFLHLFNEDGLKSLSGAVKNPGEFTFKVYVPSNPSEKSPDWDWQKARQEFLARLKKAVGLPPKGKFNSEEVIGKIVNLKISVGKNQRGEPANSVDSILPVQG